MTPVRCADVRPFLHAYGDGELELGRALEIEAHLGACARCSADLSGLQALHGALVRHCAHEAVPASLVASVRAALGPSRVPRSESLLRSPAALVAPGIAALALSLWLALAPPHREPGAETAAQAGTRVVYHISESQGASAALRNLANHLSAAPETKVIVVAHNNGVDFLLRGARDEASIAYEVAVREFVRRGVEFRVCSNTLERRHIPASQVVPGAAVVPSGIAEVGRLQSREGYAYMRL